MKRRQFAPVVPPPPKPLRPGEEWALEQAAKARAATRRTLRLAFCLEKWAGVSVERVRWTEPDYEIRFLNEVRWAVLLHADAILRRTPPTFRERDWRARSLARRLDTRFVDHQRLVAAVLSVETGMAPEKALGVVRAGLWWLNHRWMAATR